MYSWTKCEAMMVGQLRGMSLYSVGSPNRCLYQLLNAQCQIEAGYTSKVFGTILHLLSQKTSWNSPSFKNDQKL